jgi:hypothetical protein
MNHVTNLDGQDSTVGIVTGYGLDNRGVGVRIPGRVKNFLLTTQSRLALGLAQPPIKLYQGVKWQECQAVHSPSTSAKFKKMWHGA